MHLPYSRAVFPHTKIFDHVSRPNLALIRHRDDSGEVAELHAYLFNLNVSSKEIAALCSSNHSAMMPPIQKNVSLGSNFLGLGILETGRMPTLQVPW